MQKTQAYHSGKFSIFFRKSITSNDLSVCNLRRGGGLWLFFVLSFQVVLIRILYTYGDRGTGVGFGILSLYDIYMGLRNARV